MDDIFKGDKRFDKDPDSFGSGMKHIGRGLKLLFFRRFFINIFLLLLLLAASAYIAYYLKPQAEIITNECPVYEECPQCPEFSCDSCEEKLLTEYVYRYRCSSGAIVDSPEGCTQAPPETNTPYISASNGISLSFDSLQFSTVGNISQISQINITIINNAERTIMPKVGLKIYETYSQEVKEAGFLRTISLDDVIGSGSWVRHSENTNLEVGIGKKTVRLELIDTLPDPDQSVVVVLRPVEFT
ncbi:MAG TPA: hypothetical protein VJH97_07165 [Candidatus Nanoarchaeia archaeon]|nr:hypothetical protein [Candidatus Nanoarchaeia archaeon]